MGTSGEIRTSVDRLLGVTAVTMADRTRREAEAVLADVRMVRSFADAVEVTVLARIAALADQGCSAPAADVLRDGGHRSGRDARAAESRADVCAGIPALHDALSQGSISSGHVDAVARATAGLDDEAKAAFAEHGADLAAQAARTSVDEFARHCREIARTASGDDGLSRHERQRQLRGVSRSTDLETGMAITRISLDPATDARMWASLQRAVRRAIDGADDGRSWNHVAVDTIVDRLTGTTSATAVADDAGSADSRADAVAETPPAAAETRLAEIAYVIDADALHDDVAEAGVACETVDGQPVPVATVRRLACNAGIVPVVLGGAGEVLDLGRSRRLASPAQRAALAVMYTNCAFPGCDVPFTFTEVHHTTDWTTHHGPTDLANLVPLCGRDHHLVHEGGWRLELRPDRTITVTRPDGTVHYEGTSLNRRRPPPVAS